AISTPASSTPTTTTPTDSGPHARVMSEVTWGLNIRSSTDTFSLANVVANAPAGTELLLTEANAESKIGVNGQWVRVRTAQGQEGFAAAWYLEKVAAATPPVVVAPVSSPVTDAPASSPPAASPASNPASDTSAPSSSTPAVPSTPPAPAKFQVIIKAAGTPIYNGAAASASVMTTEKAGARLTVVEALDAAKAKVGVKGKRINVKASNGNRGFVDGDKVRLA
ncbi:MAG: SH3 domain-containing protein, partial [Chloroflexota bacterium]